MPLLRTHTRLLRAAATVSLAIALASSAVAWAQPETGSNADPSSAPVVSAPVGPATITLETSSTTLAPGSPIGVTMSAVTTEPMASAQLRLRISRPTGRLIFQRTRTVSGLDPGEVASFSFERETNDLSLTPGVYPMEVSARVTAQGRTYEEVLQTSLLVYRPAAGKVPYVLVARIASPPLSDPEGRFASDPGSYTRPRDEARRLAEFAITDPTARVTLAISPALLEEWKRISSGYEVVGPDGVTAVPAESAVPREYSAALAALARAAATNRLELLWLGYADPNLSSLAANDLESDIVPQYEEGLSAVFASLETTPSTGTVPAGGCIPDATHDYLDRLEVGYSIVRPRCARTKTGTATAGAYRVTGAKFDVLVSDDAASAAIAEGDSERVLRRVFGRHLSKQPTRPITLIAELGPTGAEASDVIAVHRALESLPFTQSRLGRDALSDPGAAVRLVSAPLDRKVPPDYWPDVAEARDMAKSLGAAAGTRNSLSERTERSSLLAESSAWAGPAGDWALAESGRGFSASTIRIASGVLDSVRLSISPVRLSGQSGKVPVSVVNGSDIPLTVTIRSSAAQGLRLTGPAEREVRLNPQENFSEVPVDLRGALSGRLTVTVVSEPLALESATVAVRASYLDRVAILGGLVLALGIVLAFIIRRVRAAEAAEEAGDWRGAPVGEDEPDEDAG